MTDHTDPADPLDSAQAGPQSPRPTKSPNFPPSPRTHQRRRSSFAELFANRPSVDTGSTSRQQLQAAQQAQQQQSPPGAPQDSGRGMSTVFSDPARTRRLSITTLGLSGSPSHSGQGMQTSPFSSLRGRGKSMSTGSAGDGSTAENSQESAIDESDEVPPLKGSPPQGRRVSFGARAYGSASQRSGSIAGLTGVQQGMSGSGPTGTNGAPTAAGAEKDASPTSAKSGSPPGLRKSGEGYNWAENFRNRAERASISAASGMGIGGMTGIPGASHARTKSQAQSEPAATAPKPPPQKPPPPKGPDQFQERILKGDFYMD